ncbi:hypothetical protein IAR55_004111 [Kwoniella newhampshirensis]|uniref:Uncharacterized protein n=1 Tax=Kwoniella newhampshirensis TaxID=1651941 RepID=A0AAW0YWD8_9TREE
MDALRPGHAHKSSSDRLLNNYLDSQKGLSASLLNLLSHSHSSTSSLLAYVTSSPGVIVPVRRAVRHAAFEGPLSAALMENPDHSGHDHEQGGWAAYISCLDQFRKDLKQIHLLEEEMSRVKRDREILVTRLIKTTKSRPTKSDLSAIAASYSQHNGFDGPPQSSRGSVLSFSSNGSATTKEGKRAGKLAEAQAELLGCEEHLRSLEVRIENERNKVMMRGLEDRFRSMEVVGRMWVSQAKRGLADLEQMHELPPDAFELDSNGSLAPSQSASQIAYEDSPQRGGVPFPRHFNSRHGPGSITGSIAEEDEGGSSADEAPARDLVVHENRPGSRAAGSPPSVPSKGRNAVGKPSPLGVPSVNSRARPLSSMAIASQNNMGGDGSDSDTPKNTRAGGRRAASDVGAMGYRPPTGRTPLRRTFSNDVGGGPKRGGSDTSSIHKAKKKGFFASIGRLFKGSGSKKRNGSNRSDSPPYGSKSGGWHTRTDSNLRHSGTFGGRRGGDESSSDDEGGNLVSVTNNRNSTWSVDNASTRSAGIKRSSTMPVANGLIPAKPLAMKRNSSQSTITARNRAASPTPAPAKSTTGTLSRSGTVKSTLSTKSAGTVKSTGTAKKTRANGSISRASLASQQAAEGRNIMSLVDAQGPVMPEVPKAPKSHVTPQMELAKAPGSSLIPHAPTSKPAQHTDANIPTLGRSISRSSSVKKVQKTDTDPAPPRSTTPLPPSRLLSPPLKSALRPTSPQPSTTSLPQEPPKAMYSITAPGPVQLPEEKVEEKLVPPANNKRNSYHSMMTQSDGASIYESAMEDEDGNNADSSSDEEEMKGFDVVENERIARAGEIATGAARERFGVDNASVASDDTIGASPTVRNGTTTGSNHPPAPSSQSGSAIARRKSVRMNVPDSPVIETARAPEPVMSHNNNHNQAPEVDRPNSPEPEKFQEQWSTRIGRMREDTSDEEDLDDEYVRARKGLAKNTGKWGAVKAHKEAQDAKLSKRGSTRSKNSTKSKGSKF